VCVLFSVSICVLTDDDELIGDQSKPYCLPIEKGATPPDLKCISPQTVRWSPTLVFSGLNVTGNLGGWCFIWQLWSLGERVHYC